MKRSFKEFYSGVVSESYTRRVLRTYDYVDIKKNNITDMLYDLCMSVTEDNEIAMALDNAMLFAGILREINGDNKLMKNGITLRVDEFDYITSSTENVLIYEIVIEKPNEDPRYSYHLNIDFVEEKLTVLREDHDM